MAIRKIISLFKKDKLPLLAKENILLSFKAQDKWHAIEKLSKRLALYFAIQQYETLYKEIEQREKNMSTGFEYGIAIPHAKSSLVQETACVLAISKEGIDFDALDKKLTHIIVLIVSPQDQLEEHVQTMASITKLLSVELNRKVLLEAPDTKTVYDLFKQELSN